MNTISRSLAAVGLTATLGLAQVGDGEQPSYRFRSPLLNGPGVQSLEDLQGRPVLVEFWGTR